MVSSTWWVHQLRQPGFCPQTRYLNWFGTARVMKKGDLEWPYLRMREAFKMSQGCHTCNQTTQHPVVKCPVSGQHQQVHTPSTSHWTRPSGPQRIVVRAFTGAPQQKKGNEAPHINDTSSPLSILLLYFVEIIRLLVVETNRYYHGCLDRLDEGPSPLPEVTETEVLVFLAITIQRDIAHGTDRQTDRQTAG